MSEFPAYFQIGFEHITDPNGYDHILFVVVLCAIYTLRDWKRVLVLVTAFTIGHSLTLAVATLGLVSYRQDVIELLIPVTILATALVNMARPESRSRWDDSRKRDGLRYLLALGFGLIHGLGFSGYLRLLLGEEASLWQPLLAFNLGLEAGQLLIVTVLLVLAFLVIDVSRAPKYKWNYIVSGVAAGMALSLIINNSLFKETAAGFFQ